MNLNKILLVMAAGLGACLISDYANAKHRGGADRWTPVLAHIACKSVERFNNCRLIGTERDAPADGINRIQYHFKVGPGDFDTITVHRVSKAYPGRRRKALMLLPGTGLDVENLYLPGINSDAVADDFSPLIRMARSGIDAWSADYRGSDLPADIDDFSFMADWGLRTATSDMQLAIRFARLVRLFSGNGYRKIAVGGYSAGVSVAFAVASADAARHRGRRDVGGVVAIDDTFDTDPATSQVACDDLAFFDQQIADGMFNEDLSFVPFVAGLAKDAPGDLSPFAVPPDFVPTNLQFFNVAIVGFPEPGEPTFHIFGRVIDNTGFPVPVYTDQGFVIDQGTLFEPALPIQFSRELAEIRCSTDPVSAIDGGLGKVRVPVLHIGAAGGNANAIDYTLSQLRSRDITSTLVRVLDPELAAIDYGHGDVFSARDADARVWQPIIDWLKAR